MARACNYAKHVSTCKVTQAYYLKLVFSIFRKAAVYGMARVSHGVIIYCLSLALCLSLDLGMPKWLELAIVPNM
jgi:hypothetical protein